MDSPGGTPFSASEQYARVIDVVWNVQGIFVLSAYTGPYVFERLGESQSSFPTLPDIHNESMGSGFAALAADGRSFAYVNDYIIP